MYFPYNTDSKFPKGVDDNSEHLLSTGCASHGTERTLGLLCNRRTTPMRDLLWESHFTDEETGMARWGRERDGPKCVKDDRMAPGSQPAPRVPGFIEPGPQLEAMMEREAQERGTLVSSRQQETTPLAFIRIA